MKPQRAAEGKGLGETKGNVQLLRYSRLPVGMWPSEWLKTFDSGSLWWGLALKQILLKSARGVLLFPQFLFVSLDSGGWQCLSSSVIIQMLSSPRFFPLVCASGASWGLEEVHSYLTWHIFVEPYRIKYQKKWIKISSFNFFSCTM